MANVRRMRLTVLVILLNFPYSGPQNHSSGNRWDHAYWGAGLAVKPYLSPLWVGSIIKISPLPLQTSARTG